MPANKIGSYIVQYRSRKKEEAEQERQRRLEDAKRAPKIIDPSFELFGYQSPPDQTYETQYTPNRTVSPATSPDEDWMFQNRRASSMPQPYQFEPYCEVTPKTSVSSSNSAASDARQPIEYDMGWEVSTPPRPRPQSYLPPAASATSSMTMSESHRDSVYRSRRQTTYNELTSTNSTSQLTQPSYKVGSSLSRPFSIDDPLEFLSEPVSESHLYNPTSGQALHDTTWQDSSGYESRSRERSMPTIHERGDPSSRSR